MTKDEYAQRADGMRDKLYRVAYAYLSSETGAVEAVCEAVYRGFCHLNRLREPAYLDTWLTRILLNACADEKKRQKREPAFDALPEGAQEQFDALPLHDALLRLPQSLRDVIMLRYFAGLTLHETAEALRIPKGTAVSRQQKALKLPRLDFEEESE